MFNFQLGVVLLEQGKPTEALNYFNKALEINRYHESALLNSAILLQELGGPELRNVARERLLTLLARDRMLLSIMKSINYLVSYNFREQRKSSFQLRYACNG